MRICLDIAACGLSKPPPVSYNLFEARRQSSFKCIMGWFVLISKLYGGQYHIELQALATCNNLIAYRLCKVQVNFKFYYKIGPRIPICWNTVKHFRNLQYSGTCKTNLKGIRNDVFYQGICKDSHFTTRQLQLHMLYDENKTFCRLWNNIYTKRAKLTWFTVE